jgi:hypothetical protein
MGLVERVCGGQKSIKSEGDVSHTASLLFADPYRAYEYPRNR